MLQTDAVLEKANDLKRQGISFALATVVRCESPTSAKPGAKAIIDSNGEIDGWIGGGCAQPAVIATAKKALKDGQPRLIRVSPTKDAVVEEGVIDFGMTCHSGGTLDIFIEPVMARPALLIIGGAPSAQVLSVLANRIGFAVTSACPGGNADMFPEATHLIDGLDLTDVATPPFVVVATQGKRDEEGLEAALASGAPYIAFIASERKAEKLRTYLKERGHDAARVDAIISPAGIEIGAVTPEEIALSVLAAVVKVRREADVETASTSVTSEQSQKSGSCCSLQESKPLPASVTETQTNAIDPVCGMSVGIATAEYKSDYRGQTYYFCCAGCQHNFEKAPEQYLASREETA
jgi:xanthine dehydrogenase accessory factor